MNKISLFALAACSVAISFSSCKKDADPKPEVAFTPCSADVYGYLGTTTTLSNCTFGVINEATGGITGSSTLSKDSYTSAGAYNSSTNCYYVFKAKDTLATDTLYKVNSSGVVTKLTCTSGGHHTGLAFNPATNKLYCILVGSAGSSIAEINETATTYSINGLAATVHGVEGYGLDLTSVTVNNATGDIFYTTSDLSGVYIEKYHPGGPAPAVVATTSTSAGFLAVTCNDNNNKLYALQSNARFTKIDPASGSLTTLSTVAVFINEKHYSACFNSCSNSYILSGFDSTSATSGSVFGRLYKIDTLGNIVNSNPTSGIYQGLTVKY